MIQDKFKNPKHQNSAVGNSRQRKCNMDRLDARQYKTYKEEIRQNGTTETTVCLCGDARRFHGKGDSHYAKALL